jgi:hypothetical protein
MVFNKLRMKKILLLVFTILLIGCNSDSFVTKKRLVVLNQRKDTLCILDSKDMEEVIVLTKCPICKKSVTYLPDSTKVTTITVKDNEAPIIKTLGSKK